MKKTVSKVKIVKAASRKILKPSRTKVIPNKKRDYTPSEIHPGHRWPSSGEYGAY